MMQKVYYQPKGYWFGDCMPFYYQGTYYLFHQRDTRQPRPLTDPFGWSLVTTKDFVDFHDYGEVINHGNDSDADQFIYAGSVIDAGDKAIALYTGHNRPAKLAKKTSEILMQATSHDLIHWEKQGNATELIPQKGYDNNDWRDPTVVFDEKNKKYILILGARLPSNKKKPTGRLVYFESSDLKKWNFKGDFWNPKEFNMVEMPQIIKIGKTWYLIFSEYSKDKITKYRMSNDLFGEWYSPLDEAFDGKAYYAARTVGNYNTGCYLTGWVATKENNSDLGNYDWGGALVPHQIIQRSDLTLGVDLPKTITNNFKSKKFISDVNITNKSAKKEKIILSNIPNYFLLETDVVIDSNTKEVSIRLFENEDTEDCYEYTISLFKNQLKFDKSPNYPWPQLFDKGLQRPLKLVSNKKYHLKLIVDDNIAILYIDGVALSTRMYSKPGNSLSVAVTEGAVKFTNLQYHTDYMSGF